jgi:ribonuclease G
MGKGKIQASILFTDQIEEQLAHEFEQHGKGLQLHLHPYIYAYVTRGWWRSLASKWRRQYGVKLVENQSLGMLETRFIAEK